MTQLDAQENQNQAARKSALDVQQREGRKRLETLKDELDAEVARIVGTGGLPYAMEVIDALLAPAPSGVVEPSAVSFESMKARILQQGVGETDLQGARSSYDRARSALKGLDDGIEDALERLVSMKSWTRKFALFKRDALSAMAQVNDITLQISAQQQSAAIYDQLAVLLEELQAKFQSSATRLNLLALELRAASQKLSSKTEDRSGRYEFLQEIEIDFAKYFVENASQIHPSSAFQGMLPSWALKSAAALDEWSKDHARDTAHHYAAGFFEERLENTSLLSTLQSMAVSQGVEPVSLVEEYLNRLVNYCHPFWRYDQDCGLTDTEGKSIIGVEDENSPLLPASYRNGSLYEIKTTGFKDRIDVVRLRHGLPAFLIRGMNEWKGIYERKRKGLDPLHVLPDMDLAADVMPDKGKKQREVFAAAMAFGYIVQVGSWYYFDPEKGYASHKILPGKEYRLAQGREKAEDVFSRKIEWIRTAVERIDMDVREMGNAAAIQKLAGVIECYKADISQMKSPDEAMRKQYEKEMNALSAMQRSLGKVG